MPLLRRLWIYQRERIPLFKTAVLLAVFSAASVNVSALLAGRPFPHWAAYATAFAISLIVFMQLRACDEYKDGPDDQRFRPERPIPRGLVSLRLILTIGAALVPVAVFVAWLYFPPLIVLLALVWVWLALMTVEFFVPDWLKARPILYLVSHMAIMPLLDLFVTGVEWLPAGGGPAAALFLFLLLSFVNGCVLEIGRKTWAPENEREGVETYSNLWGVRRAVTVWIAITGFSFVLLVGVGFATGHVVATAIPGLAMLVWAWTVAFAMRNAPDGKHQAKLDTVSGLWVFVCYSAAGFSPLAAKVLS
ncbi:UbiA family prenyltransferase [Hoeflea prorocentri]|uniref:UbiA family prenyltransferase n=1 Tax=Hoeflea prorocentri TaxID=1922333 RepID=A0A9X3ULK4_9HYPH|nr:UbiA family prenyltransferase [Hoeflea prorocentri]MCY6383003.1 UbiA family prenyltransferase [Hoeflea prorocentri]MDA5400803.1 UbiA family prenyltransferase [Hoeflea prorocentri]